MHLSPFLKVIVRGRAGTLLLELGWRGGEAHATIRVTNNGPSE